MSHFLSELLPDQILAKSLSASVLRAYLLLLRALSESISAFDAGSYDRFDSLVGENACQTRAVRVVELAHATIKPFVVLRPTIVRSEEKVHELLKNEDLSSDASLGEYLRNEGLDFALTSDELFLLQAFLLSEAKVLRPNCSALQKGAAGDLKPLKRFAEAPSAVVKAVVNKLRRDLSQASVDYTRRQAHTIENGRSIEMTSEIYTIHHNDAWPTTPMFWTYKVLLEAAHASGVSFLLHIKFADSDCDNALVDEDYLLFQPDKATGTWVCQKGPTFPDLPVCVIEGVLSLPGDKLPTRAEWHERISSFTLEDIVLAGAADHRQYPDEAHDQRIHDLADEEFMHYRALAKREGFSLDNPSTFFIQHVYAAHLAHLLPKKRQKMKVHHLQQRLRPVPILTCVPERPCLICSTLAAAL